MTTMSHSPGVLNIATSMLETAWTLEDSELLASTLGLISPTGGTLVLLQAGPEKIRVIKVAREITGLGLKEAKDLVDQAELGRPVILARMVNQQDAAGHLADLTNAGAGAAFLLT